MRLAPEAHRAANIRWQLFVALTWRGQPPRAEKRERLLRGWLRRVARKARVPYDGPKGLLWFARDGDPGFREVRPHFHVLIGRLPPGRLDLEFGCALARFWFGCGGVEARLWDESLGGFDYGTRVGANDYESKRFVKSVPIMCSESLSGVMGPGAGALEEQEDTEQSEYPGLVNLQGSVVLAGSVQSHPAPAPVMGLQPARGYIVAANASRTGLWITHQADITG